LTWGDPQGHKGTAASLGHLWDEAMIVLHAKAMLQSTATYSPC